MIRLFKKIFSPDARPVAQAPAKTAIQSQRILRQLHAEEPPETLEIEPRLAGRVVSNGPGKNVLVRTTYQKRAGDLSGGLEIVDDPAANPDPGAGIDPYNTGKFDRSKNWDKRFRK